MAASAPGFRPLPSELQQFQGYTVRGFLDDQGEPWWVARDVCEVLEIKDTSDAVERLDEDEKGKVLIPTPGGSQELWCVNESGLYALILGSRKPQARIFRRWVIHEVLPAIRKTGQYRLTPERVLENVKRPVQIQHSKEVATFLYPQGKQVIIRWMVDSFVGVKGMPPKTYVKNAYFQGDITNKNLSGREALRRREPPKACVISLMDELRFEFQADDITAIEVAKQFEPGFRAILNAGLKAPAELGPSPLEQQAAKRTSARRRKKD